VRYRFPIVKLDDRNGFCHEEENKTMPYAWVDEYSTLEQFDFNPKAAAVLHLNWQVSLTHPSHGVLRLVFHPAAVKLTMPCSS
jgi:hypothetical protein